MEASPSTLYVKNDKTFTVLSSPNPVSLKSVTRAGPVSYLLPRSSLARDVELAAEPTREKLSVTRDCLDLVLLRVWRGSCMGVSLTKEMHCGSLGLTTLGTRAIEEFPL